jgi:hypothetical protein
MSMVSAEDWNSTVDKLQRYSNQLIHAAGFIEGMAARIDQLDQQVRRQWVDVDRPAISVAANELRAYAQRLREITNIKLE